MTLPSSFRQNDVKKALIAATNAGLQPSGFKICPTGEIVVIFGESEHNSNNSFDALIGKSHG